MRKKEQNLWDSMKRNKPSDVIMERIENGGSDGMPDVLAKWPGGICFIELKATKLPQRPHSKFLQDTKVERDQLNWFWEAENLKLPAVTLVRSTSPRKDLYLFFPDEVEQLNQMTLVDAMFRRLVDGTASEQWAEFWGWVRRWSVQFEKRE